MAKRKTRHQDEEAAVPAEADSKDLTAEPLSTPPRKRSRKTKSDKETPVSEAKQRTKRSPKKAIVKVEPDSLQKANTDIKVEDKPDSKPKPKAKRKTKEEKEAAAMPLAARTAGQLHIGAHVSASGGVHNAVLNAVHIGANAFALFFKSQRKWANPPLSEEVAVNFLSQCKSHTYDAGKHVVPHGSYLVNLAHTDKDRTKQAYDSFLDDLQRCERLGITLYNFHPGNTAGIDRAEAIKHLASNLNKAHKATTNVVTLLENMAAGGNVIGTTFEDLRDIISHIEDKSRVGVCLDTCHAFAAGYDLRTPEAFKQTLAQFDKTIGLKYLRALHINDSKAPFESHRDLHANIGTGFLGLRAFHNVVNEKRLIELPLVLETPTNVTDDDGEVMKDEKGNEKTDAITWAREIKLLENLVGMDTESEEFLSLERSLAKKGEKERNRLAEQAQKRLAKDAKKATKKKKKVDSDVSEDEA